MIYKAIAPWHATYLIAIESCMPVVVSRMHCCLQHYADNDLKLRRFVPIIQRSLVYPVILDAKRTVLSLPPIINGAHSAVRL